MIRQISNPESPNYISDLLSDIISRLHKYGPISAADFEKLALIKHFHPDLFAKRESEIMYLCGLFYKVEEPKSMIEEVYSIYADAIQSETGKKFTPIQASAYKSIKNKKFFSFSAPTSAGKSFLFRELITGTMGDIIIVVPSRALIAEYMAAVKKLVDSSVLVLQFIENVNVAKTNRRVFIITPERGRELFYYKDIFNIELILFDEAQLSEEEIRGIGFDAFVRRASSVFPEATKVFAHPFVKNPEAQLNKHHFAGEDSSSAAYTQNAVGKIFVGIDDGELFYFSPYEDRGNERYPVKEDIVRNILEKNGTILIYTSKSKLYSKGFISEFRRYLRFCPKIVDPDALKYVDMLRNYIGANKSGGKSSLVVKLMERGVVIHHGSMPLKMRLIIEDFVRGNYAKLCFATSTLNQGINMPFDAVYIDNFKSMDVLTLKNLIGRSGRSTKSVNDFEYGFTIIDRKHIKTFCSRINESYMLKDESSLDDEIGTIDLDDMDLVEAIHDGTFDDKSRLTKKQLERIQSSNIEPSVKIILDSLFRGEMIINGKDYYESLTENQRRDVKDAFKKIYLSHLRRDELTPVEQSVLSTAIPILLWLIQGKTFKEVLALRYAYLTRLTEQRTIRTLVRKGEITATEAKNRIELLKVRFSQAPYSLPNARAKNYSEFKNVCVLELEYDALVFDTYDYIDKVIGLSLADPLCAAFQLYFDKNRDCRAEKMVKYIRYGTIDETEIWLLRYGFSFEDIVWIKELVEDIDENEILFSAAIDELQEDKYEVIRRYL